MGRRRVRADKDVLLLTCTEVKVLEEFFADACVEVGVVGAALACDVTHAIDGMGDERDSWKVGVKGFANVTDAFGKAFQRGVQDVAVAFFLRQRLELLKNGLNRGFIIEADGAIVELRKELGRFEFGTGRRGQRDAFGLADGTLGGGIKVANALNLIAKEFNTCRRTLARGPEVKDAAVDGKGERFNHEFFASIAQRREAFGKGVKGGLVPNGKGECGGGELFGVGNGLQEGVD